MLSNTMDGLITAEEWLSPLFEEYRNILLANTPVKKKVNFTINKSNWTLDSDYIKGTNLETSIDAAIISDECISLPGEYFSFTLGGNALVSLVQTCKAWNAGEIGFYLANEEEGFTTKFGKYDAHNTMKFSPIGSESPTELRFIIAEDGGVQLTLNGLLVDSAEPSSVALQQRWLNLTGYSGVKNQYSPIIADCSVGKYENLEIPVVIDGGTPTSIATITLGG